MEDIPSNQTEPGRAITLKSVFFGLLGIFIVSGLAGFHDTRLLGTFMVGTHLPVGAFFYILMVSLFWNLAFSRLLPSLVLSPKELVVVMGMTLMGCFPPTSALCRYFQKQLILPWYYLSSGGKTEWEKLGILDYIPKKLFPSPAPALVDGIWRLDDTVYRGFFTGLVKGNETIGLHDLPWAAWMQPLMYWAPLIVLMSICVMAMTLLVHKQWSDHEQLSYPIAQVASAFVWRAKGKGVADVFRSKLFWWGFAPIFALYTLDYVHQWLPLYVPGLGDVFPNLKNTGSIPIADRFPIMIKAPGYWALCSQTIFFSVVGLAYFVSTEISFTMGASTFILVIVGVWYFVITGTPMPDPDPGFTGLTVSRAGAYLGYALILVYTGRSYYSGILKKAFMIGRRTEQDVTAVMAARLTLLSFTGFVVVLTWMGLDWVIALAFSFTLMLLFLVFTRIMCETGIPFMTPSWFPSSILVPLFGPAAVGPGPLVIIIWLGTLLCQDPRECLMPYVATSVKMADDAKIKLGGIFWLLAGAVLVALVVAFVSTTWTQYNFGGMSVDGWAGKDVPTRCFDNAAKYVSEMGDTGVLAKSTTLHGLAKLKAISVEPQAMGFFLFGLAAVIVFSVIRFRFARFPLHPVMFLVWGTWPTYCTWGSFMIGWGIKSLIVRFGGGRVYQDLKPFFIGIIAGELIAAGTGIFIAMLYYFITGRAPSFSYNIMVG